MILPVKSGLLVGACLLAVGCITGCSTTKVAQNKAVDVQGQKFDFGGKFETKPRTLTILINGDPVMTGNFGQFTPTLNLSTDYKGAKVGANCYFASILGSKKGPLGIISGAVQGAAGQVGDKCELLVNEKPAEVLYF